MHLRYVDDEGHLIEGAKLADTPSYQAELRDEEGRLLKIERYRKQTLVGIQYADDGRGEQERIEAHLREHAALPFQIYAEAVAAGGGSTIYTTKCFDERGRHIETVIGRCAASGDPDRITYVSPRGEVVKHTRFHYGSDGELEYEFDYGPDGSFRDCYDYLKEDGTNSLLNVPAEIALKYRSLG